MWTKKYEYKKAKIIQWLSTLFSSQFLHLCGNVSWLRVVNKLQEISQLPFQTSVANFTKQNLLYIYFENWCKQINCGGGD